MKVETMTGNARDVVKEDIRLDGVREERAQEDRVRWSQMICCRDPRREQARGKSCEPQVSRYYPLKLLFFLQFPPTHPDLLARVRSGTEVNVETTGLEIWRKNSIFVLPLFPTKNLIYGSLINTLYFISFFSRVFGHDAVAREPTGRFPWNHQR